VSFLISICFKHLVSCLKNEIQVKGAGKTQLSAWFVGAAYNLLRMAKLVPQEASI